MFNTISPSALPKVEDLTTPKIFRHSDLGRFTTEIGVLKQEQASGQLSQSFAESKLTQLLNLAAEFSEEVGNIAQACSYWHQLTQLAPQNAAAWHGLGVAKANLADYPGATQALNQALRLDPSNLKAKLTLAELQQLLSTHP